MPNSRTPYIIPSSMRVQAKDVRREVGTWFNTEVPAAGWIEAKKNGYRVVKIEFRQTGR
jgi:hypothetical protein